MNPLLIAAIVGAAVSVGGAVLSYLTGEGKTREAEAVINAARDEYGRIQPEKLEEAAISVLGPTEMAKIQADPKFKAAQEQGLAQMEEMQAGGGFNNEDRANLNRIRNETARRNTSRNALLREEMQARGIGGSGAELAMRQADNQAAAERESQAGLDTAAQAQKRYFDAIRERTRMAGDMRAQDFGEQAAKAQAQDRINQYNQAFQFDQARYNNDIRQKNYANQVGAAERRYGMAQDRANLIAGQGARSSQMIGGVASNLGNAAYSFGKYLDEDSDDKKQG